MRAIGGCLGGLVLSLFCFFYLGMSCRQTYNYGRLAWEGQQVSAVLTTATSSMKPGATVYKNGRHQKHADHKSYLFKYSGESGGQEFQGECLVDETTFKEHHEGDKLTVTVLPSDSSISHVGGTKAVLWRLFCWSMSAVFFAVLMVVCLGGAMMGKMLLSR